MIPHWWAIAAAIYAWAAACFWEITSRGIQRGRWIVALFCIFWPIGIPMLIRFRDRVLQRPDVQRAGEELARAVLKEEHNGKAD